MRCYSQYARIRCFSLSLYAIRAKLSGKKLGKIKFTQLDNQVG